MTADLRDSLAQVLASFEEVSDKPYLERLVNGERIQREAIAWLREHGPKLMKDAGGEGWTLN